MASAASAFQNLKESMHARLTSASLKPPPVTPARNLATSATSLNPTQWKGFTIFGDATSIIGQAMRSLVTTVGQSLSLEDFPEDVDGMYLTNHILVMGPVRRKFSEKDRFRNDLNSIRDLVLSKHGGFTNIMCFDFAPAQSLLDCDGMKRAVIQFDLDRPTLEVLREACAAVVAWLDLDEKNVAILTCTNGIKSTCLVAACVYAELHDVPFRQGLCKFFEERMKLKKSYNELLQKLPPSYDRLLKAYERERNQNENMEIPMELHAITLQRVPFQQGEDNDSVNPKVLVRSGPAFRRLERVIQASSPETILFNENDGLWKISFKEPLIVQGDITLDVSLGESTADMILFSFPFPVGIFEAGKIRFGPDSMDEVRRHILPADFSLELHFQEVERLVEDASFAKTTVCGKELCSLRHIVKPSKQLVSELMSSYDVQEREAVFALQRTNNDLPRAIAMLTKSNSSLASSSLDAAFTFTSSSLNMTNNPKVGGGMFAQQENQTQLNKVRKGVLAKFDENSAQKRQKLKKGGMIASNSGPSTSSTTPLPPSLSSGSGLTPNMMVTPAKRRLELMEDEDHDDPTLSPFLRETIGKGLSSPITPAKPMSGDALLRFDDDAVGEMDKLLLAQLAQLLQTDSSMAEKVEKLAEGKATIVLMDKTSHPVGNSSAITAGSLQTHIVMQTSINIPNGVPATMLAGTQVSGESMVFVPASSIVSALPMTAKYQQVLATEGPTRKEVIPPATPAPSSNQPSTSSAEAAELTIAQHETYGTFFKMLKMGVPREGVEQKMKRDGFLVKALDLGPSAPISKLVELERESQKTVGQDEIYGKYFKMLKMGVPPPAVQQRMVKDGCIPEVLDLGENAPLTKLEAIVQQKSNAVPASTKKKVVRQKTIRWDAIPEERLKKGATIWHHESGPDEEDLQLSNELESLFIRKPDAEGKKSEAGRNGGKETKDASAASKCKSFLDARRAQSICIGVAKLKMTGAEYATALNALDETILTSKALQVIQGCNLLPSAEEAQILMKQKPLFPSLAEPDEFLYQVAKLCPDATGRIEALTFRYLFEEIAQQTKDDADRISQACEQVRNSQKLKDLLRVVLLVGNQINSRGAQSDDEKIRAFTLNSLLKLSQTKSLNKTTTVLEYLVGFLMNKMPQVLDVAEELGLVNVVKRVDLNALSRQIRDLRKGLDGVSQAFKGLEQFCASAYKMMAAVETSLAAARAAYEGVLGYFGEDNEMLSVDLFSTLSSFLVSFTHTRQELVEREKRNARKKQQQQQQVKLQAKKAAAAAAAATASTVTIPAATTTKASEESGKTVGDSQKSSRASDKSTGDVQTEKHPHLAEFLRNL